MVEIKKRRALRSGIEGLGLITLLACGSGGSYRGDLYSDGEARYALEGPQQDGWQRVSVQGANDLAWMEERLGAIIQANANCSDGLDIPLRALTQHLLFGFTEREVQSEEHVPMDGREALRTHVRAKLDGVDRELLLMVLKKDGCVYDFALVAPPQAFDQARARYDEVVQSFRTR